MHIQNQSRSIACARLPATGKESCQSAPIVEYYHIVSVGRCLEHMQFNVEERDDLHRYAQIPIAA